MHNMTLTRRALGVGALGALATPAVAQTPAWPNRPLRWIVGYPAGGATDVVARIITAPMAAQLGQPIVIDNRSGAAGVVAAEAVAKSPPDGHTAMSVDMGIMVYNRALYRRLPYDPARDFRPVSLYARFDFLLAVHPSVPARTAQEFVALARARPGGITMASVGVGSPHHLALGRFMRRAGIEVTHVPYRGAAPAVSDLVAGTAQAMFLDYASGAAFYQSGQIRPLAAASAQRLAQFPDVPTLAEAGFPDNEIYSWHGAVVRTGTPDPAIARLRELIAATTAQEDVARRIRELGAEPIATTPEEFQRVMDAEAAIWLPLIRDLGITLDT